MRSRGNLRYVVGVLGAALVACCLLGAAEPRPIEGGSEGLLDAAPARDADATDEVSESLLRMAGAVRALIAGELDVGVDPATLFDVRLDDDRAVQLEAARLSALLREDGGRKPKRSAVQGGRGAEAGIPPDVAFRAAEPMLWGARQTLDRARLAFYERAEGEREAILANHARRVAEARASRPESEEDRRGRESDDERKKALDAAQRARTQAERNIATEVGRLLDVARAQSEYAAELERREADLATRREATVGWVQRVREARAAPGTEDVDHTYDSLRRTLRQTRTDLADTLAALNGDVSNVPKPGPDSLAESTVAIDTTQAYAERARVDAEARRLHQKEREILDARATELLDEIDRLNAERLGMLPILTSTKRQAIIGFGHEGWDQASAELRQLSLIARYHRYAIGRWIGSIRSAGSSVMPSFGPSFLVVAGWLVSIASFFWWRRRAARLLVGYRERLREIDRRSRAAAPSRVTRFLSFLIQVRSPLEWIFLLFALRWLLPPLAQGVLEVELAFITLTWVFTGGLVVETINALATREVSSIATRDGTSASLRLRSLRLIGRVVVVFGLILVTSTRVVGRGTIYEWVFSTCWLASPPIFLLLVRWWREEIFVRIDTGRRKSRVAQWILANRHGWKSFLAAMCGAVVLLVVGSYRAGRHWVGRFNLTRRVLAYLFRRQLDKLSAEGAANAVEKLPTEVFDRLGPETPSARRLDTDADESIAKLVRRIAERRGGVFAIVGERGIGKTTTLARLRELGTSIAVVDAHGSVPSEAARAIARALGAEDDDSLERVAERIDVSDGPSAIAIDDAHRLMPPVMGGLATLDALLRVAGAHSARTTWILTFDAVVWQFLERARGARPLFDDVLRLGPWSEEGIANLIRQRTKQAEVSPRFDALVEAIPPGADEGERTEALEGGAARYYRLLWDYAAGNPSVALHMWRRSLGIAANGDVTVHVNDPLDTADFEMLPDPAVFVLRAVLQLAPAHEAQIRHATMLSAAAVDDALRYAFARGYLESHDSGYRVTWTWYRAMTRFLQRRHLLPAW